jgi:RND family efflux transporter MFP subunit
MTRRATNLRLTALVLALSLNGCGGEREKEAGVTSGDAGMAAAQSAPEPVTVEVVPVVERPLDVTLTLPGELQANQSVAIYPRVSGFVKSIAVDRGSRVAAGEMLVTLDAPELIAQRAEAQSKLESAQASLGAARSSAAAEESTYEKLRAASQTPGVVAGNDLLLAQKAVEAANEHVASAEKNVEAARQALESLRQVADYLRVKAPFRGVVTERNVHPGALVGPSGTTGASMPMLRLVDDDRLRLVVPVPEAYTAAVEPGSEIAFEVAAHPGERLTGTVARIARAVDPATRTMAVEVDVANADHRLAPGTFCQVRWPVRRDGPSLLVPNRSVAATTDRTFVVRVRDGKTEWVNVRTGLSSGPMIEVFGELRAGDLVATRGTDEIAAGTAVEIREPPPPA